MYTRDFNDENLNVPREYGGVAFEKEDCEVHRENEEECMAKGEGGGGFLKGFSGLFQGGLFGGTSLPIIKNGFKLGTEELLLLALAAFLFFSKDGDKECALILLFLIFVN